MRRTRVASCLVVTNLGCLPGENPGNPGRLSPLRLHRSVGQLPQFEVCPYIPRMLICMTSVPDCQLQPDTWPGWCRSTFIPAREHGFHSLRVGFPEPFPVVCRWSWRGYTPPAHHSWRATVEASFGAKPLSYWFVHYSPHRRECHLPRGVPPYAGHFQTGSLAFYVGLERRPNVLGHDLPVAVQLRRPYGRKAIFVVEPPLLQTLGLPGENSGASYKESGHICRLCGRADAHFLSGTRGRWVTGAAFQT